LSKNSLNFSAQLLNDHFLEILARLAASSSAFFRAVESSSLVIDSSLESNFSSFSYNAAELL